MPPIKQLKNSLQMFSYFTSLCPQPCLPHPQLSPASIAFPLRSPRLTSYTHCTLSASCTSGGKGEKRDPSLQEPESSEEDGTVEALTSPPSTPWSLLLALVSWEDVRGGRCLLESGLRFSLHLPLACGLHLCPCPPCPKVSVSRPPLSGSSVHGHLCYGWIGQQPSL